jgi:hypothetical protein
MRGDDLDLVHRAGQVTTPVIITLVTTSHVARAVLRMTGLE